MITPGYPRGWCVGCLASHRFGGQEKGWTDCVADDCRVFSITGDQSTAALDPGAWYTAIQYTKEVADVQYEVRYLSA